MTNEFFQSLTDELHALNHRIHTFLSSPQTPLPEWGLASSLRQILRKHIPASLGISRGVIVGEGVCSALMEVMIYSQDFPVLYREGDIVFVSPASVRGLLSVVPPSGELSDIERALRTLAQTVAQLGLKSEELENPVCFSALLAYGAEEQDAEELVTMLECITGEQIGAPVSALCLVGGDHISLETDDAAPQWGIRTNCDSLYVFFQDLMLSILAAPETRVGALIGDDSRKNGWNNTRIEPTLLANQEVLKSQTVWTNGQLQDATNGDHAVVLRNLETEATAERAAAFDSAQRMNSGQGNNGKKDSFFRRLSSKVRPQDEKVASQITHSESVHEQQAIAGLDSQDHQGNTLLHKAVMEGKEEQMVSLLRQGANINIKNKEGNTPLHLAAHSDQMAVVRILLDHGAEINARNYIYCTPLHLAAATDNEHTARILLDYGAEIEARNNRSLTPLHRAATCGSRAAAEVLIAFGADLHAKTEKDIMPLHLAAWYGQIEVLQLLIESNADRDAQNADGNTALHLAAFNSQVKAIKTLINYQANMDIANHRGETYLQRINEGYQDEKVLVLED